MLFFDLGDGTRGVDDDLRLVGSALDLQEVRKAETNAQLVAENIATQLERRIAFRRAVFAGGRLCS